jgi:uncharacterized membrane protein YfcA
VRESHFFAAARLANGRTVARVTRRRHDAPAGGPLSSVLDSNLLLLAAVPITGFAAGFINTLAGSGSLVTLPILILLGLPANVANGTNRVGVLVQNVVAVATFRRRGALDAAGAWLLVVPSVVGSVLGARLAVDLDEVLLRRIIGVLMVVLLAVMLVRPERWLADARPRRPRPWLEVPLFFVIGIYGGFLQVGVGIFLIAALVLGAGFSLVGANAMKNVLVLAFTAAALVVFVANGQVQWTLGLLLAAGQGVGAWVAARLAVRRGARFVRWFVVAVVVLSAGALFSGLRV